VINPIHPKREPVGSTKQGTSAGLLPVATDNITLPLKQEELWSDVVVFYGEKAYTS